MAVGKHALPVYEIFKVGQDLFWQGGLDLFSLYGLNLTIIPHWNNQEGEDFDTSRCFMGSMRFENLGQMLPKATTIVGIDEQTALLVETTGQKATVMGIGTVTVLKNDIEKIFLSGRQFSLNELR